MNARKTLRIQRRGMPMNMMTTTIFALRSTTRSSRAITLTLMASSLLLTACTTNQKATDSHAALMPRAAASQPAMLIAGDKSAADGSARADEATTAKREPFVSIGTGQFVNPPGPPRPAKASEGTPVSFNLENGDIRELVKNVIVDTLKENVIVHPSVTGTITVRTPKPLARNDLIPALQTLLRGLGFSLVKDGEFWRVLPQAEALQGTTTPRLNARAVVPGQNAIILPVKYIGAKELQRLMVPFTKAPEASIRVDEVRNLMFLFGTETEVRHLLEIADMFDVDLLSGMSFIIYPLVSADVKTVVADWDRIFPAAANPLAGLVRLIPIERMNALMVISPNPDVVKEAKRLLERLDNGMDAGGGTRLYVYDVQYTQAEKLQATLQQALSGRANPASTATVAPGQTANTLSSPVSPIAGQGITTPGNTFAAAPATPVRATGPAGAAGGAGGQGMGLARNATVIADKDRNALLIVATQSEYNAIEAAIKKLDTPPKMIAIEVQIAQVALTGALQFGLSGVFVGKPDSPLNRLTSADGTGTLSPQTASASSAFSYTWQGAAAKAMLNTLQNKGQSRTIASPTMMTLDNQKVSFTNGTQISVQTQSTAATSSSAAVNSYQYINTGLTINITPRVSGENVFLEIQQQNSNAQARTDGNPNPDIVQNSQQTTVMVPNGDTMLLGGLFLDSSSSGSSGLPFVSTIPVLGGLFGNQSWNSNRSELVMLVTPRVMASPDQTREVVDDLRKGLAAIEAFAPSAATSALPTSGAVRKLMKQSPQGSASSPLGEFGKSLRVESIDTKESK
jgi:general secretion pathway protein D